MKLSEFAKPAGGAIPVPGGGVEPASGSAAPQSGAAQDTGGSAATQEVQYFTSVTPSGIEVAYSPAPRRHYKLRGFSQDEWNKTPVIDTVLDWREVPSVTNVLGVLDKSGPLVWWSQKIGVQGVIDLLAKGALDAHGDMLFVPTATPLGKDIAPVTADTIVDLLVEHKISSNHQRDKAADRGINVHDVLEAWAKNQIVPDSDVSSEQERGYVEGLYQFIIAVQHVANVAECELMVGSLQHSYAGRFDLVLTLSKAVEVVTKTYPKRKPKVEEIPAGRYLLDLKTSKGIYNTHYLQLEAYETAAVECGYEPTDHRGVIHVTADGRYELALNKDWCFDDFLAVRRVYSVLNEREVLRVLREDLDATEVK